jgi:hypothetical protein
MDDLADENARRLAEGICYRCGKHRPSTVIRKAGVVVELVCSYCIDQQPRPVERRSFVINNKHSPGRIGPADLKAIRNTKD